MAYAERTKVPVAQSRGEIEKILARHGADAFGYTSEVGAARIAFRMKARHYRFGLPLRDGRGPVSDQETRARWRALVLVIKAKLEAVAAGITTIEEEFLNATVMPDGSTVGEWAKPQLEEAYRIGAMPKSLMLTGPP
jgi:hypothetical protein